jgi:hypothetical protein
MKTNDLKKGVRIMLKNGWEAELWDNMKGNTRIANVYGFETEASSIYSHDIIARQDPLTKKWINDIEYTPSQIKCREMNVAIFGG